MASGGTLPVKASARPQPQRPISMPPTPAPLPRPSKTLASATQHAYNDLGARLKKLLPTGGPVEVHVGHYAPKSFAKPGFPTPPPEVLAATKFLYESQDVKGLWRMVGGKEQRVVMYVTAVKNHGAVSTCTGWLIRFPLPPAPYRASAAAGPFHGGGVTVDNPGPGGRNAYEPVVESDASFQCETARLQPYVPGSAPSPGP